MMKDGFDPADAIVQGVRIIENDPNDDSVGLGGLPNADGVVQLDASVMHGPTHKSGAVACLENIKNPAMVALMVLRRTDHCLLVGEGALRFAKSMGFREENLLTENSRRQWQAWRENMSKDDDWLNADEQDAAVGKTWNDLPWQENGAEPAGAAPRMNDGPQFKAPKPVSSRPFRTDVTGTVHLSALTAAGDIASCTSTSGLNWKIPGRVGDSPIVGAGNYCDNAVGSAGSTGRGEAAIVNLASFLIVDLLSRGIEPAQACLDICKKVVDHTKEKRLKNGRGLPNFNVRFYALRKDGAFGSASLYGGSQFAVADASGDRLVEAGFLLEGGPEA
ncbi:MAG: N(4)-(beta-N-acetylglucosaminyl)-L-asparaginase [bacterium]|nr:N(4)-(beta-N-acetylglucosaminyl)-L-asparaginase [bacterium]